MNFVQRLREDKNYYRRSICVEFSGSQLLVPDDKNVTFASITEDIIHMRISSPAFKKKKGTGFAIFQALLNQNNPYAKVAYFGVAYSATLHRQKQNTKANKKYKTQQNRQTKYEQQQKKPCSRLPERWLPICD